MKKDYTHRTLTYADRQLKERRNMARPKVRIAQPKPLTQSYLILTNNKVEFKDRIAVIDLFLPDTQMHMPEDQTLDVYKSKLAEVLWNLLFDRGFRLNSELENQYQKQQCCIWCGGTVITYSNGDPETPSWETRCADCNYLYDED
jgi:hypothetical protein